MPEFRIVFQLSLKTWKIDFADISKHDRFLRSFDGKDFSSMSFLSLIPPEERKSAESVLELLSPESPFAVLNHNFEDGESENVSIRTVFFWIFAPTPFIQSVSQFQFPIFENSLVNSTLRNLSDLVFQIRAKDFVFMNYFAKV